MVIGIIAIIVGPFVAYIIGKRPTDEHIAEQTRPSSENRSNTRQTRLYDFTPKEALRTRAFWSISMTHTLVNLSTGAISAHLFLHLTDENGVNLDDATASGVMPILVITAFVFQLAGGIMGDRFSKRILVLFMLLLQGASLVILALAESFVVAAVFAVVWGIGFGARTPLLHAMRGEYFGRRHLRDDLGAFEFPDVRWDDAGTIHHGPGSRRARDLYLVALLPSGGLRFGEFHHLFRNTTYVSRIEASVAGSGSPSRRAATGIIC